jgi:hypothetical protein
MYRKENATMNDRDDRILDACLAEVLGGQHPPDLSDRILQMLATRATSEPTADASSSPRPARPMPLIIDNGRTPHTTAASTSAWKRPAWLAVAASLLALLVGYSLLRAWRPGEVRNQVVEKSQPKAVAPLPSPDRAPREKPVERTEDAIAAEPQPQMPSKQQPAAPPQVPLPGSIAKSEPVAVVRPETSEPARQVASASRTDAEIVEEINTLVRARWSEEGLRPAVAATEGEWCRRVYLDIVGRLPTLEESNRFLAERGQHKRARLIERLLTSDTGVEEYARNWTNIWTALLIGRTSQPGSLVNREGMQQYLRRSLLRNKSYDEFVAELISADGGNTPGMEDFNGAVNFVLDNLQENAVPATAKTARLFLGMQVQCTQCHNHPFNDWKQDQFWELNSFYRQAKAQSQRASQAPTTRLVDVDFAGEGEVYWEMRNGLMKVSYPTFVDGKKINPSGSVANVNRRDELARLVARSQEMPRAIVNRLWAHFLGYGFTRPVDDMGPHNPPSHPELLDLLAREFVNCGFDLKRLISWIAQCEPYALSSRVPAATLKDRLDEPMAGTVPLFSYFYVRQMRPEELYESLLTFAGQREAGSFEERQRVKSEWLRQFTGSYGTEENDEYTTFNGSITQTLMMFNGELMRDATRVDRSSFLRSVLAGEDKPNVKIGQLFLAALGRRPTGGELQRANQLWLDRKQDAAAALQDIWWAVLNSNEFIMNH